MRKLIFLTILFSNFCVAGSSGDVVISTIMSNKTFGEKIYIKTSPSEQNDCSPTGDYPYRLDTSTEIGKLMASLVLAAYMSGKTAVLIGTGECTGGNAEILKEIILK